MIDFWAPWCKPCVEFEPDYSALAKILHSRPNNMIRLSSYDVTKDKDNKDTVVRYKITTFPALLFFINGIPIQYEGNRKIEHLLQWMKQILDAPQPLELRTIEDIN